MTRFVIGSGAASLAAQVRESWSLRPPTTSAAYGRPATDAAHEPEVSIPTLRELLEQSLAPALVAGYTAAITVITELVPDPTTNNPQPDQYIGWRWALLILLVALSGALMAASVFPAEKMSPAKAKLAAKLAVVAVMLTSAAWGLGLPESPIMAGSQDTGRAIATLAVVGFLGIGLNALVAQLIQKDLKQP